MLSASNTVPSSPLVQFTVNAVMQPANVQPKVAVEPTTESFELFATDLEEQPWYEEAREILLTDIANATGAVGHEYAIACFTQTLIDNLGVRA